MTGGGLAAYPSILEKSATARVASLISFSSFSRFSRTALSSALTVTLSKKASTWGRSFAMAVMAAAKSSLATAAEASVFATSMARASSFSSACCVELRVGRAGVGLVVLLLLDAEDVGRALGAGQQVLAVVGVEEFAERLDAADDQQQIVLAFEREHGVDQIVPRALLAELDLEAVGEER